MEDDDHDDDDDEQPHRKPIFLNQIRSDGYTVDVLLTRQNRKHTLPDLEIEDFEEAHLDQFFELWALDPGIKDIFQATNGDAQYRRFSTKEWRAKCGITRRLRHQQRDKTNNGITAVECSMPTMKTASTSTFIKAAKYVLTHLRKLTEFYGQNHIPQGRLLNYSGRQKLDHEMVQIFIDGGKKYTAKQTAKPPSSIHPK